jgi:nucleotide-binding universal stress UspA family protein
VLVAYDGSEPAEHAASAIAELVAGQDVVIACAWTQDVPYAPMLDGYGIPYAYGAAVLQPDQQERSNRRREHEALQTARRCAAVLEPVARSVEVSAPRADRSVAQAILDEADRVDASMIVVGPRSRSRLSRLVVRGMSDELLHHADRPVTVVRDPSEA